MPRTVLAVAHRIRRRARRGLRSAAGQAYRYDAQGRRVRSEVGGAQRRYSLYAQDGRLLWQRDEVAGTRSVNVYLAGSLVAEYRRPLVGTTASVGFLHTDPLGSPIAKTDATGAVVETSEYEPYGLLLNRANDDRAGYTGHVMDSASGLTYMQQRYYDPQIGRFLSVDPVTADAAGGTNFNRYWYANNNPYRFTDPDGRSADDEKDDPPPPPPPPVTLPTVTVTAPQVTTTVATVVVIGAPWEISWGSVFTGISATAGAWISAPFLLLYPANSCESLCGELPLESRRHPTGVWPGDQGAREWGKRHGVPADEAERRFHDIKQSDKGQGGGKGLDNYGTDPRTGDVYAPDGEIIDNLGTSNSEDTN